MYHFLKHGFCLEVKQVNILIWLLLLFKKLQISPMDPEVFPHCLDFIKKEKKGCLRFPSPHLKASSFTFPLILLNESELNQTSITYLFFFLNLLSSHYFKQHHNQTSGVRNKHIPTNDKLPKSLFINDIIAVSQRDNYFKNDHSNDF